MTAPRADRSSDRVLALPLLEPDAASIASILEQAGVSFQICSNIQTLCEEIEAGAGAALLAEDALEQSAMQRLVELLGRQSLWSDFPVLVLFAASSQTPETALRMLSMLEPLGNVTVLDRPIRAMPLVSAVRAAARARERQYQVRDLLRALEENVRNRDEFLMRLAHEVRTPLSTIQNATQILNRIGSQASVAVQQRTVIARQTERLGQLIADVLDISRLTEGRIVLHHQPVDLIALARRRLQILRSNPQAQRQSISFATTAETLVVEGDPDRLEQVLDNLLTNAIQFTPPGGRVTVSVSRQDGEAVVSVKDTGIGLDSHLLAAFRHGPDTASPMTQRPEGGLKIGLTLARGLVILQGGRLDAFSAGPNQGSEFIMRLPLRAGAAEPPTVVNGPRPAAAVTTSHRVLLIEDNDDSRETLRLMLQLWGHQVEAVGDGPQALLKVRSFHPEVALVDIGLPGSMDGFDVARQLRCQLGLGVVLIALTGLGQPQDRRDALAKGFDAYLVKPVEPHELQKLLEAPPAGVHV